MTLICETSCDVDLKEKYDYSILFDNFFSLKSGSKANYLLSLNNKTNSIDTNKNDDKFISDKVKPCLEKLAKVSSTIIAISLKNEKKFVDSILRSGINSIEFKYKVSSLSNVQRQIQELVEKDFDLYCKARNAYKSYVNKYIEEEFSVFKNQEEVDHVNLCHIFGLSTPIHFVVS